MERVVAEAESPVNLLVKIVSFQVGMLFGLQIDSVFKPLNADVFVSARTERLLDRTVDGQLLLTSH